MTGLAAAWKITSDPHYRNSSLVLLERNAKFGQETSSRNSEVIHAGIYYPEDSLKARLCIEGKQQLYHYCNTHDVPYRRTGKLLVANESQQEALQGIFEQAQRNGVSDLEVLNQQQLRSLEPALSSAFAVLSPSSGIIDSHAYMQSLLHQAENNGALFAPLTETLTVEKHSHGFIVSSRSQNELYHFTCSKLINVAGLNAQAVARSIAEYPEEKIPEQLLVKGSYFMLQGRSPFSHLVYPVPEPGLKGLGIHVTLDMSGQARFGPDAEQVATVSFDVDSNREAAFRKTIGRYYPGIEHRVLQPAYSGIRPRLTDTGGVADFVIQDGNADGFPGLIQLFGIESPGLTASLAIADEILRLLRKT